MTFDVRKIGYLSFSPEYQDYIVKGGSFETDVVLISGIDKRSFRGHRIVVASASPVLRSLLSSACCPCDHTNYITFADLDGKALQNFLALCYTGKSLPFATAGEVSSYLENYKDLGLGDVVADEGSKVNWTAVKKYFDKLPGSVNDNLGFYESHDLLINKRQPFRRLITVPVLNSQNLKGSEVIVSKTCFGVPKVVFKCLECPQNFQTKVNLQNHIATAHNINFTCKNCGKKFLTSSSLVLHASCHKGEQIRLVKTNQIKNCPGCLKSFRSEEVCQKHTRHCPKYSPSRGLLSIHSDDTSKTTRRRNESEDERDSEVSFEERSAKKRKLEKQDGIRAQRHLDEKAIFSVEKDGRFSCLDPICSDRKSFSSKYGVIEHWQDKHSPDCDRIFECDYCDMKFALASIRNRHINNMHEFRFTCEFCEKKFATKANLQNHEKLHSEESNTLTNFKRCQGCLKTLLPKNGDQQNCTKCHASKNKSDILSISIKAAFAEENDSDEDLNQDSEDIGDTSVENEKTNQNFVCRFCLEEFSVRSALRKHMSEHQDEIKGSKQLDKKNILKKENDGRFSCLHSTCSNRKSFSTKYGVIEHWQDKHAPDSERIYHCDYCDMKFALASIRNRHVRYIHEPRFICQFCKKQCSTKKSLENHEKQHLEDKINQPKTCSVCLKSFLTLELFKNHIKDCTKMDCSNPRPDDDEDDSVRDNQQIAKITTKVSSKKRTFECRFCLEEFRFRAAYRRHMITHQDEMGSQKQLDEKNIFKVNDDGRFACLDPSCINRNTFGHRSGVLEHWLDKHAPESDRIYHCDYCDSKFALGSLRNRHVKNMHEQEQKLKFSCKFCDKKASTRTLMDVHERLHTGEKPFVCDLCGSAYRSHKSFKEHQETHQKGRRQFQCDECEKTFFQEQTLNEHKFVHESAKFNKKIESTMKSENGRYFCTQPNCSGSFQFRHGYREHFMEKHLPESDKVFECEHCPQKFGTNALRNKHEKLKHEMAFECNLCDRKFGMKALLLQHMRWHTGDKPYVCEVCGAKFLQTSYLKQHMNSYHTVEEIKKSFKCQICDKLFRLKGQLNTHLKTTHSETRVFVCEECGKNFKDLWGLKRHQETHVKGELTCPICNMTLASKASLARHHKSMHSNTSNTEEDNCKNPREVSTLDFNTI